MPVLGLHGDRPAHRDDVLGFGAKPPRPATPTVCARSTPPPTSAPTHDRDRDDAGPARHDGADGTDERERDRGEPDGGQPLVDGRDDNVAVTGYRVERCQGAGCSVFTEIGQPTGTTFSDSGRTASTSYSYRVRAIDAATNLGPYSTTATATTPASTSGLVAGYAFNEGLGTSAADASGSGLTGTLRNGAGWGTGRNGGAVLLDGVNDFVELGESGAAAVDGEHDCECVGQLGGVPPRRRGDRLQAYGW